MCPERPGGDLVKSLSARIMLYFTGKKYAIPEGCWTPVKAAHCPCSVCPKHTTSQATTSQAKIRKLQLQFAIYHTGTLAKSFVSSMDGASHVKCFPELLVFLIHVSETLDTIMTASH